MLKILKADKDAYITNKIVRNTRKVNSNTGGAGTLDLFKVYGTVFNDSNDNIELSRILIHFDLEELKLLHQQGKIDINDDSFACKLKLKDVYGGQPTPVNFKVSIFPLSASFTEGIGKDISYYSDSDVCSWLSSSSEYSWNNDGCNLACTSPTLGDYITSSTSVVDTGVTQNFITGDEDLVVDVTTIVSATLTGELPDTGYRISLFNSHELDNKTYFVKRFASRQAYDETKRPQLIVGFDDSISDDTQNLTFDVPCQLTLYNYVKGELANIVSGSTLTEVSGNDCLNLRLLTEVSGGYYELQFQGSQFKLGQNAVPGVYQATVTLPTSDAVIGSKLATSGSVKFIPIWASNDLTVGYVTGSILTANPTSRSSSRSIKKLTISCSNISNYYGESEEVYVKLNIFDHTDPLIKLKKLPVELPGLVLSNVYYQIRDSVTNEVLVPFDNIKNSTKVSSDANGMFFKFHTSSLRLGHIYVIDIMTKENGIETKHRDVSPVFRIEKTA